MSMLCDETELNAIVEAMKAEAPDQLERVETALTRYAEDARLHFLRGSMLIGAKRLIEAHGALARAVELAPDFAIARFQLGFFLLTSGEADAALDAWGRLDRLPDTHYLRQFVDGLRCLIRDDFPAAIEALRAGIALNQENPPLSRDMQLIIDQCQNLAANAKDDGGEAVSETAIILRQFSRRSEPE